MVKAIKLKRLYPVQVTRVAPMPLPPVAIRIKEESPSDGCSEAGDADQEDFEEFETETIVEAPTGEEEEEEEAERTGPEQQVLKPKSPVTFVVALMILAIFGLIIIGMCAFGILGPTPAYEAQVE